MQGRKRLYRTAAEAQLIAAAERGTVTPGPWMRTPVSGAHKIHQHGKVRLRLAAAPDHSARLAARDQSARLADLFQSQPLRVLFPYAARGDIFQAAIACVSGGLVGGDRLDSEIVWGLGARAVIVGQAAEKIYRSLGPDCVIENRLVLEEDSWGEYLPQETILFEGARLRRRTQVSLAPNARFMGGDIILFGRKAHGERLTRGLLHDAWEIRDENGALVWKDALHLDGDLKTLLAAPAAFDGAAAYGSLIYAGADAAQFLDAMRDKADALAGETLRIGATSFRNLLILRFIGRDARLMRDAFAESWRCLRGLAAGLPPALPRLWAI